MTTPFDSKSYAKDPTAPTAAPAGYVTPRQPDTARREPPFDTSVAEAMRGKLIELIIRQLLTAIFGFFTSSSGSAFSQFANWAATLPFIGAPLSQAIDFITQFLDPAKLLFSQTRVQNPPQAGWPLPFSTPWGELTATPIQLLVQNLSRFLSPGGALTGGSLVSAAFNTPTALLSFIEGILLPRNRVAERDATTGLVPDSQKPQAVQDIVDHANNAVIGNPVGALINFEVATFFDVIGGLFGAGSNAQNVNITQNAQIDALLVGGTASAISETFDGASSASLTNFTQFYYGSGSGTCGRDGSGNAVWHEAGASVRGCINQHVTALTTDTQKASIVLKYNLVNQNVDDPAVKIQVRCKSDMSECIEARIDYNSCEIGYVVANVYTRLGSASSIGASSGVWELKAGTLASSRQFILYRNGAEVCNQTDTLASSALGINNRQVAFTLQAGVKFLWIYAQTDTGVIDSFSASDIPIT